MDYTIVYRFQTWDREQKKAVWRSLMGTREAVRREKGEADLESALQVGKHEIDANGLYPNVESASTPNASSPGTKRQRSRYLGE